MEYRVPVLAGLGLGLSATTALADDAPPAELRAVAVAMTMFGGQLVRPTLLDGAAAVEVGGGGALYATERLYWGGGGGTVYQLGDAGDAGELELFHGELLLGYDLVQRRGSFLSAMALAGFAATRPYHGLFFGAEARLAARRRVTEWFMLGAHVGYRRALGSDVPAVGDADLSAPVLGLELYFTL
jgi:hypothetical protein